MSEWESHFERLKPLIANALDYAEGTHTLDDVRDMIAAGRVHLWPAEKSVVLTEFVEFPQMRTCNFWLAAGDMAELAEMEKTISPWAKAHGCARVTIHGRKGWAKTFLADRGYAPKWVTFSKEL